MSDLREMQARAYADSAFWFPPVHGDIAFLSLGLGGEVGEVQNAVKKYVRGSMSLTDMVELLKGELPDVLIYLLDLAEACKIDLPAALETKRAELIERWGDPLQEINT